MGLDTEAVHFDLIIHSCEPSGDQLPPYVERLASSYEVKLTASALAFLCQAKQGILTEIDSELKNLSLRFAGQTDAIDKTVLEDSLSYVKEDQIFKFDDLLLHGKFDEATLYAHQLLNGGTQAISILGVLARHCRIAIRLLESPSLTHKELRMPYSVVKNYKNYLRGKKREGFLSALQQFQEFDTELKSGSSLPSNSLAIAVLAIRQEK